MGILKIAQNSFELSYQNVLSSNSNRVYGFKSPRFWKFHSMQNVLDTINLLVDKMQLY